MSGHRVLLELSYGESAGGMGHVYQLEGLVNGQRWILWTWAPHIDGPMDVEWLLTEVESALRNKVDLIRDLPPADKS